MVVNTWIENPYWQYFTGQTYLQTQSPIDPSSLTRWRKRIGEAGVETLLQLTIVAAPAPRFISVIPQTATGDVRLEWLTSGQPVQLERAESVDGPYVPLTSMDTNSIFVDMGILLGRGQAFYRLRQKAY